MTAPHHPARLPEEALLRECDERRTKGSGPGGQHRNKVETKVVLRHRPTGIEGQAGERRSQKENRAVALRRLRMALALGVRASAADAPSPLWRSRCRGGRVACSPAHADFPALLAEALDVLAAAGEDAPRAAAILGCTPTQVVRLLGDHPPALAAWNGRRAALGLRALR